MQRCKDAKAQRYKGATQHFTIAWCTTIALCFSIAWCFFIVLHSAYQWRGTKQWHSALQRHNDKEMVLAKNKVQLNKRLEGYEQKVINCVSFLSCSTCSGVMYEFGWVLHQLCCRCKQHSHAAHSITTIQTHKQTSAQAKISMKKL